MPGSNWGGTGIAYNEPPSGTEMISTNQPAGNYTFGISCQSIDSNQGTASAQAQLTVQALTASLTVTPTTLNTGSVLTLSWSSNGTSCAAGKGGANGTPWSGSLASTGSITQTATTAGTFTYEITCTSGTQTTGAQTSITVSAPTSGGGSSGGGGAGGGGGHSGGGAISLLEIAAFASLTALRKRRTSPSHDRAIGNGA